MQQHLENLRVNGESDAFEKLKIILCTWGRVWRVGSGQGFGQEGPNHVKEHGFYPGDHGESLKGFQ